MRKLIMSKIGCHLRYFKGTVNLYAERYMNNRLALTIATRTEPVATCTVNLADVDCPDGEIFVKDYSENEGMASWLKSVDVIAPGITGWSGSGYVEIQRYRLTQEFKERLKAKGV